MRKIVILAAGSQGDIQPCLALAKGMQAAGWAVSLAAPQDFAGFIRGHGVDFFALRGDVRQIMASDTGREFMETGGGNPIRSIVAMRRMISPIMRSFSEDAYTACRTAQGVICLGVFAAFGQTIAEALKIPVMYVEPTPLLPTRAFPAASWPIQRSLGGWHNYLSGVVMLRMPWLWYSPFVNDFRRRLGLSAFTAADFYRVLKTTPMLGAYSPRIIPRPPDWPPGVHVSGYFFLDAQTEWQPPPSLEAFLQAGDPPVYIGFGSMAGRNPQRLAEVVLEALAQCGRRGVLLTGWGGLRPEKLARHVFVLDAAPHSWLFPRMAAVVHHGGAGTTAEGLRAGVPSVIVPFILDQPFWGARVQAMGLGPPPVAHKNLTAGRLAEAIETALTDAAMRARASRAGAAIRAENGVVNALGVIEKHFG